MAKKIINHRLLPIALIALCAVFTTGCMLSSGRQTSTDARPEAGNTSSSFISAEGEELSSVRVGPAFQTYEVIAIVAVEQGELQLEIYDASGAPALSIQGRPEQQVTRSGRLASDEQGNLRFRVTARSARNGGYQILYRRVG
jgi:hypothetical protein